MIENIIIERGREADRAAILEVMRPWNMHHVPSIEMETMEPTDYFVARLDGKVIGAAGYALLSQTVGKTTLLGVLPEYSRFGVGKALQQKRLETLHRLGVKTVITNSDRPATIKWLTESYGFRPVGTLKKLMSFGDPEIDHWTTLQLDLQAYMRRIDRDAVRSAHIARHEPHPLAPYPPLLIQAVLGCGDPAETIVAEASEAVEAGAQILEVALDGDADEIARIVGAIRQTRPEVILCLKTSIERLARWLPRAGEVRPDLACLTLGSLNLLSGPCINPAEAIGEMAGLLGAAGVAPVMEIYDQGMMGVARQLERDGLLPEIKYFNLKLGNPGTAPATLGALAGMIAALPEQSVWSAGGMGVFQTPMCGAAIVAGGGVRLAIGEGLGEGCADADGNNTGLIRLEAIRRAVRLAAELERPVASMAKAREMLGLASLSQ